MITTPCNYDGNAITCILIDSVKEQQVEINALKNELALQNQRLFKLEEKLNYQVISQEYEIARFMELGNPLIHPARLLANFIL